MKIVCFKLIDKDGNNVLDRSELEDMIRHAYLAGLSVILAITPKSETNLIHSIVLEHADHYAKTHTAELFDQMDTNKDGSFFLSFPFSFL